MPEGHKTICHKINKSLEMIAGAVNGESLDILKLTNYLHEIRKDASRMEEGLKSRKKIMLQADPELERKHKAEMGSHITTAEINKLVELDEKRQSLDGEKHPTYTVQIVEDATGETLYKGKARAGLVSFVEKLEGFDKSGSLNGQTQHFMFGHSLGQWFAFDQMLKKAEHVKMEWLAAMKSGVLQSDVVSEKVKAIVAKVSL